MEDESRRPYIRVHIVRKNLESFGIKNSYSFPGLERFWKILENNLHEYVFQITCEEVQIS